MSGLARSSIRLADDLLSTFEDFVGEVHGAAAAYRDAKASGVEDDEIEAAGTFLRILGEGERRFHDRFVRAAHDSRARDEELTG
jgi:hypothetical protein